MTTAQTAKASNFWWYIAAAVIILIILAVTSYQVALPSGISAPSPSPEPSTSPTPSTSPSTSPSSSPSSSPSPSTTPSPTGTSTSMTLYAGAVTSGSGTYGFGNSASDITSPGPTLNLVEGMSYSITVDNVATDMPHSFEVVPTEAVGTPLFGAGIDINTYISAGGSGSVTFTPNQTGNFYYVCTVPGHVELGMWGKVVVTS